MQALSRRKQKHLVYEMDVSEKQKKYVKNYLRKKRWIRITQILIFIFLVLFWQISVQIGFVDPFIFSSPVRQIHTIIQMSLSGALFYHMGITILETLISFFLVNFLGIIFAIVLWWNGSVAKVFEPYLVVLNSLPKSALAPVFIVWLGNNMKTIIIAAISVSVFGTIITLYTGFLHVETDKVKLIRTLGGNKKDVLWKVVLPANVGTIISQMKVNIGLSLVGVIIGEFLAAKAGLGYLIIYGSQVFKLDWVIMSIIILCFIATILYKILSFIEKKVK